MADQFSDYHPGDLAHLYTRRVHPEDEKVIDRITTPKNWDFANFKQVIIMCSKVGEGNKSPYYIPASNVPETIHMGILRKHVDELNELSKQKGHEFSRTYMVDVQRSELIAGKRVEGEENKTTQGWINKSGLVRAVSIHTHPTSAGFSDIDYQTFIGDPEQMAMMMTLGESTFLTLKNTATPNNMVYKDVEKRIKRLHKEFFPNDLVNIEKLVGFNKAVCLELGLNLFIARNGADLLRRVNVAS